MDPQRLFSSHTIDAPPGVLGAAADALLEQQRVVWPMCRDGYAALESIRTRTVACDGFDVRLQFNPKRIVSTGAKVDPTTIRERPCFLCMQNLPPEQLGVQYHDHFIILCNPAPIFPRHLTITHVEHRPQVLEPFLDDFFRLAKDLSPGYSVFYNGPRCGASAPDHMHFQACPKGAIPVEEEAREPRRRSVIHNSGSTAIAILKQYGRSALVFESTDPIELKVKVRRLLAAAQSRLGVTDEPMLNAICTYRGGVWRMILFLRSKHRPEAYFKEGEDRILISPASVDIGGLIITPVERDFERVDAAMIQGIFAEVSLPEETVIRIVEEVR